MSQISLKEIRDDYNIHKVRDQSLLGHPHHGDFSNITLHVEPVIPDSNTWRPNVTKVFSKPEVVIENGSEVSQLETLQSLENYMMVKICAGLCPELANRKVTLDLPFGIGERTIHFNNREQVLENGSVEVKLTSSGQGSTRATVPTEREEITGAWTFRVWPKGRLHLNGANYSVDIQRAIEDLFEVRGRGPGGRLNSLSSIHRSEDGRYCWFIEGLCVIKKAREHGHNWSS